jgi:hypothetical protein
MLSYFATKLIDEIGGRVESLVAPVGGGRATLLNPCSVTTRRCRPFAAAAGKERHVEHANRRFRAATVSG